MTPIPLLFLGDAPASRTGLGRIGRDIACLVSSTLPEFRVGYMGRGTQSSRQLPFHPYVFPESDQWGESHIERNWADFAGTEPGIIFSIWDASRLHWLANPKGIGGSLEEFLSSGAFRRWGYFPVDSYGVGGKLTALSADTLRHYDRVLAYGAFGADTIGHTVGSTPEWIPHGLNFNIFQPRDRVAARMALGIPKDRLVLGCVMTNQARKDWGLAFATAAQLMTKFPHLVFWAHVDVIQRHWDLLALAGDFQMKASRLVVTSGPMFDDTQMSYAYSACDVTMLPSLGEGFGYPIVESMACGVPVVTGNYGGGVELVPSKEWLVNPVCERLDGPHNCVRPVYVPDDWVDAIDTVLKRRDEYPAEMCRASVEHLSWELLWPATWKKWFLAGLR